jgi:hypothetical protein
MGAFRRHAAKMGNLAVWNGSNQALTLRQKFVQMIKTSNGGRKKNK